MCVTGLCKYIGSRIYSAQQSTLIYTLGRSYHYTVGLLEFVVEIPKRVGLTGISWFSTTLTDSGQPELRAFLKPNRLKRRIG
jgi:hypothetical protein